MKLKLPEVIDGETPSSYIFKLSDHLGIKTPAARIFLRIALENVILMDRKQLDYGPRNISKGGIFGCLLRASDKFERLFHLFQSNRKKAVNESIEDSFRDISNYMIIAIMLSNKEWPNDDIK